MSVWAGPRRCGGSARAGAAALAAGALLALLSACQMPPSVSQAVAPTVVAPAGAGDPRRAAQARLELAAEYLRSGRAEVALEEVDRALALRPGWREAYLLRGSAHAQQRNFQAAEADYERVLRQRSDDVDALHNMAWMRCQQGRYDEADGYFARALAGPARASADRARTLMAHGVCLQSAGRSAAAVAVLQRAAALEPGHSEVAYQLARALHADGQMQQARVQLAPLNASARANAQTLWLAIQVENSLANLSQVRELGGTLGRLFPNSREFALYERGAFYE